MPQCAGYNVSMNRLRAFLPLAFISSLLAPLYVRAADLPLFSSGWSLVPEACRDCPCGFAGVMGVVQNLVNVGISVGILLFVIILAWAGFLFIASATNPESRSKAKSMLINAAIGLMIILSAWLMVDFIMKALYSGPDGNAGEFGPWNSILTGGDMCVTSFETRALFSGAITSTELTSRPTTPGTPGGGPGSCRVPTSGACAYTNFIAAFGSEDVARQAGITCYGESGGVIQRVSATDIMRNDPQRRAFSFGLFQINITVHQFPGLNCPNAFNGRNYTATVKDEALYAKCVAAAKDATKSIAKAVVIYRERDNTWAAWSAAKKCGLAQTAPEQEQVSLSRAITRAVSLLP